MIYLPICYAAPIIHYYCLVNFDCEMEIFAHYTKQTLANRCYIATSQGVQCLTVPIEKPKEKCLIKDVKISGHSNWQTQHWRAIKTAYSSTPFFDFYADSIVNIYEKKHVFLFDFNINLQNEILNLLNYSTNNISLSVSYEKKFREHDIDLRNLFADKKKFVNLPFNLKEKYYQVFSDRFGFLENLSIFDLIFNMGNESRIYLKKQFNNFNI